MSGFSAAFYFHQTVWILADFHSQILWGFLFQALEPWAGDPRVGWDSLVTQGEPLQLGYPTRYSTGISHQIFNSHIWMWGQPVSHLHPMVMGRGKHSLIYSAILTGTPSRIISVLAFLCCSCKFRETHSQFRHGKLSNS